MSGENQVRRRGWKLSRQSLQLLRNQSSAPSLALAVLRSQPRIFLGTRERDQTESQPVTYKALPKPHTLSLFMPFAPAARGKIANKTAGSSISSPLKSLQLVCSTLIPVKASLGDVASFGNPPSPEGLVCRTWRPLWTIRKSP